MGKEKTSCSVCLRLSDPNFLSPPHLPLFFVFFFFFDYSDRKRTLSAGGRCARSSQLRIFKRENPIFCWLAARHRELNTRCPA